MIQTPRNKPQTEIQQAAIYAVTDKRDGSKFFLVKSDSCADCYHEVRFDEERLEWICNGDTCKYQHRGAGCKHAQACSEVMVLRRAAAVRLQAQEERALANLASGRQRLSREEYTEVFGIYE